MVSVIAGCALCALCARADHPEPARARRPGGGVARNRPSDNRCPTSDRCHFPCSISPASKTASAGRKARARRRGRRDLPRHRFSRPRRPRRAAATIIDALGAQARSVLRSAGGGEARAKAPYPGYPYGYLPPLAEALARSQRRRRAARSQGELQRRPRSRPPGRRRPATPSPSATPRRSGRRRRRAFAPAWRAYYSRDGGPRRPRHARVRRRARSARGLLRPVHRRADQRLARAQLSARWSRRPRRARSAPARTPITAR